MRVHAIEQLRNVALIGHGQAGKTSLAEAVLSATGVVDRLGSVDAGTTVSDSDPEEIAHKISISLAYLPCEWGPYKINLLDTPGYADFAGEVSAGLRVADGVVLVIDATAGVEVQTERYAAMAAERGLPRMIAITKLDKEHTDFARSLAEVRERLNYRVVPVSLPIGSQTNLSGVVDLIKGVAYITTNGKESQAPIPEGMAEVLAEYQDRIMEAAAEADDAVMEKYLEEGSLSSEEIVRGLRTATLAGKIVPAVAVASISMVGIHTLLDTIIADLPGPGEMGAVAGTNPRAGEQEQRESNPSAPLSALIFKTTADPYAGRLSYFRVYSGTLHADAAVYNTTRSERERIGPLLSPVGKKQAGVSSISAGDMGLVAKLHNSLTGDTLCDEGKPIMLPGVEWPTAVFSLAISAKSRADEDKVGAALGRLNEEDPTISFSMNPETKETILTGMGDLHLELAVERLQRKFSVQVETGAPKIPYRETLKGKARVQGRHKKQTGGRGQFGDVWVQFEPLERGAGIEFVDAVKGGSVPKNYIPAVEKGIREAAERGVLARYALTDFRAILDDGSSHSVDSSDMAFKMAGQIALQKGAEEAGVILLEPVVEVEVMVPAENMGDVIGIMNSKRGSILGMEPKGQTQIVRALVPLSEMTNYASQLRSVTGGRGSYTMRFSHYQEVPPHISQSVIAEAKREK